MASSDPNPESNPRRVRLAYLVSHPIQYQAPLLRRIAQEPDIDLTVFFGSDFSLRRYEDKGFGVGVQWDLSLVEGYRHDFLPVVFDSATVSLAAPMSRGILSRLSGSASGQPFDVVWIHGYASINSLHAILVANALGIPVLLRAESTLTDRPRSHGKLLAKSLFFLVLRGLVAGVLPIGTRNALYWRHYLGVDFPAWPMPYAVDNNFFRERSLSARPSRAALQAELNLDPLRPVILFASKLQQRKRCIDLLEAYIRIVTDSGNDTLPYLVIVGEGEERKALEARVLARGLDGVRFCGFRNQSELPRFFDLASIFVLPSRNEPWGLIVNEVMNAARSVIVSDDVGCQPDLITDGVEGLVFPVGDVAALTAALRRLLDDPEAAARMGQRALERVQSCSFEADVAGLRLALASLSSKIPAKIAG